MRSVALPGTQRRARDHRRRPRRHQGARNGPIRRTIPRCRVQRARVRLSPPRRKRWRAKAAGTRCLEARRLAGRNLLRPELAWRRRREARDLGLLGIRRTRLHDRVAQSSIGGSDRAFTPCRRSNCNDECDTAHDAIGIRAPDDARRRRHRQHRRWPQACSRSTGRSAWRSSVAHHTGCTERRPSAQPWQQVSALAARSHSQIRTARGILSSWPIRIRHPLPPTGCRL